MKAPPLATLTLSLDTARYSARRPDERANSIGDTGND